MMTFEELGNTVTGILLNLYVAFGRYILAHGHLYIAQFFGPLEYSKGTSVNRTLTASSAGC